MRSLEEFQETFERLKVEIGALSNATNASDISDHEMKAVRMLQLLEFEVGSIGQEMYEMAKLRRGAIHRGEITEESNEDTKRSDTGRAKRQPNRKTKRASR